MDDIYCSKCGEKNSISEDYCIECGSILRKLDKYESGDRITSCTIHEAVQKKPVIL